MKITFLGTGTSCGVPVLTCKCPVCLSNNYKDKRQRSSIFIQMDDKTEILIDVGPDFRAQALKNHVYNIDGLLLTHTHADHIMGINDLREVNFHSLKSIPIYTLQTSIDVLTQMFPYLFKKMEVSGGIARITLEKVKPFESFQIKDTPIIPLPAKHGSLDLIGFAIGSFAYLTDVNFLYPETITFLKKNTKFLILDALREKKHPTHFSFEEALEVAKLKKFSWVYFTHFSHSLNHTDLERRFVPFAKPSFDNLTLQIDEKELF